MSAYSLEIQNVSVRTYTALSLVCGDSSFGPAVANNCRGGFDFTLLFEESLLAIAPAILLLLVVPLRLFQLHKRDRKVVRSPQQVIKLCVFLSYGAVQLALLVLWAVPTTPRTRTSIPSALISFLAGLGATTLSYAEHFRSIRPSLILDAWLFVSLLFDVVRARTLWLLQGPQSSSLASVFTAGVALKFVLLVVEAREKRGILRSVYAGLPYESTSGLYSRGFFWWLTPLFLRGYKKVLSNDDLYMLDEKLASKRNLHRLENAWQTINKERKHALALATAQAYSGQLIESAIGRLCTLSVTFGEPFLINRTINLLKEPNTLDNTNIGKALVAGAILLYTSKAILNAQYNHSLYRGLTMVRGGLISLIYAKAVDMQVTAVKESAAMSLMASDVERIPETLRLFHDIWSGVIQTAVAIYLLEKQLGLACLAPLIFCTMCTIVMLRMARYTGPLQTVWMEAIQKRVNVTSTMLDSMKGVKMLGLSERLFDIVQDLRNKELMYSVASRKLQTFNSTLANLPTSLGLMVTLVAYTIMALGGSGTLDTAKAFTSASLVMLALKPIEDLIWAYPSLEAAIACFDRVEAFLRSPSRKDHRILDLETTENVTQILPSEQTRGMIDQIELANMGQNQLRTTVGNNAMTINNGTFGWNVGQDLLRDINISFMSGSLTMVVGAVGSGKSTLLKALLGEIPGSKGFVHVSTLEVGFCDQTPWVLNGTIQENILGQSSFDSRWYGTVLHACALTEDLQNIRDGDQAVVGSQGITLSGGQKQRVAIARAVYAQKPILLFDDVFSGLDGTTEKKVFARVFGRNGLLRKIHATTVLVTHSMRWLAHADQIIALGKDGTVAEQGTFEQLIAEKGYVHSLSLRHHEESDEEQINSINCPAKFGTESSPLLADDPKRKTGDFSVYHYWLRTIGTRTLAMIVFWAVFNTAAQRIPTLVLNWWSAANDRHPNQHAGFYLGLYAGLTSVSVVGLVGVVYNVLCVMTPRSARILHMRQLKTVMNAPMSFFSTTDTGITANRFSQDMRLVDMTLPGNFINVCFYFVQTVANLILTAVASSYVGIVTPFAMIFLYILQKFYLKTSRQLRFLEIETKSPLYSQFIESLNGLPTLRAFGWQRASLAKNVQLLDTSQKPYYLLFCIQRWLNLVLDMFVAVLAMIIVAVALNVRGKISGGYLGVALVTVNQMSFSLSHLIQNWTLIETSIGAISRIKKFEAETDNENLPGEDYEPDPAWPATPAIIFQGVSASYTGSSDNEVLKNVNLSILPGEKIGLCGRSGSGKSSLISVLFRMLEMTAGTITVDGCDISILPRQIVRSRLIALPQEPFFLEGSVRLNINPERTVSDSDINTALEKVHLAATISALGGLDSDLDPNKLSQGQRQLFCLARAMLKRSTILVLDEVSSSVDVETDALMQKLIREVFKEHTVIAVAHRLDTILDFDKVGVMDNGVLVEFDSPANLLTRDSHFKELYESRSKTRNNEIRPEGA